MPHANYDPFNRRHPLVMFAAGCDMRDIHILLTMDATRAWRLTPIGIFASKQGSLFSPSKETESASP